MPRVLNVSLLAVVLGALSVVACGGRVADVGAADSDSGVPNGQPGPGAGGPNGGPNGGPTLVDGGTSPAPTTGITCGMTSCDSTTQECCIMAVGPGGPGGPMAGGTCTAKGACMGGVALSCSSASGCMAGNVCCVSFTNAGGTATCAPSCMGMGGGGPGGPGGGGGGGIQLCAIDAECPMGEACVMGFGGLKACRRTRGGRDGG